MDTWILSSNFWHSLDFKVFYFINRTLAWQPLDKFFLLVSEEEHWGILAVLASILCLVRWRTIAWRYFWRIGLALAVVDWVSFRYLKFYFARARPCITEALAVRLVKSGCGGDYGFPSNHAANGFAVVAVLLIMGVERRWILTVAGLALLVGYSRIYLGVHYPFDVLMGFIFGFGLAGATITLAEKLLAAISPAKASPEVRRP